MATPPTPQAGSPAATQPSAAPSPAPSTGGTAAPANQQRHRAPSHSAAPSAKRLKMEHATATAPNTPRSSHTTNADAAARSNVNAIAGSNPASKPVASAPSMAGQLGPPQPQTGEKDNFDSLVDIMGASGVDLRAEEEAIQQRDLLDHSSSNAAEAQQQQHDQDGELYLQVYPLAFKVHTIAQKHGLGVDASVLNYLSLAARTRFRNMLEMMVASSRHRSWSSHQHPPPMYDDGEDGEGTQPMYHETLLWDPRKQLAALERAERGDEARRRKERLARDEEAAAAEAAAASAGSGGVAGAGGASFLAASSSGGGEMGMDIDPLDPSTGGGGGGDGMSTPRPAGAAGGEGSKRKPKKIGPGVAARNMSEDVQKRLANSTALRNLGGSATKYSWLQSGAASTSSPSLAAASPLAGKGKLQKSDLGGGGGGGAGEEEGTPSRSRLPKPKFAPQPSMLSWKGGSLGGSTSAASSPLAAGGGFGGGGGGGGGGEGGGTRAGAWGDVAARQREKEEEETRQRLQVTLRDALFALEYERGGAAGWGSGEAVLYRARAKVLATSSSSSTSSASLLATVGGGMQGGDKTGGGV